MQKEYWGKVHQRALVESRHALWIDTKERTVIAIIIAALSIFLIWTISGSESAKVELIARIGTTAAIVLAFPFIYAWKFLTAPARIDAELTAALKPQDYPYAYLWADVAGPRDVEGDLHLWIRNRSKSTVFVKSWWISPAKDARDPYDPYGDEYRETYAHLKGGGLSVNVSKFLLADRYKLGVGSYRIEMDLEKNGMLETLRITEKDGKLLQEIDIYDDARKLIYHRPCTADPSD